MSGRLPARLATAGNRLIRARLPMGLLALLPERLDP